MWTVTVATEMSLVFTRSRREHAGQGPPLLLVVTAIHHQVFAVSSSVSTVSSAGEKIGRQNPAQAHRPPPATSDRVCADILIICMGDSAAKIQIPCQYVVAPKER